MLESGKATVINWQNNEKVCEATFEEAFEGMEITCGYMSRKTEKIILGTKSGAVITIC